MLGFIFKSLNLFIIPSILFFIEGIVKQNLMLSIFWGIVIIITIIGSFFAIKYDWNKKHKKVLTFNNVQRINKQYNKEVIKENLIIIALPLIVNIIFGFTVVSNILIIITYILLIRTIIKQDSYNKSIYLLFLGYNYYQLNYTFSKDRVDDIIIITKYNYSQLVTYMTKKDKFKGIQYSYDNELYIKKED